MTADEDALLATIADRPDDDLPRLVYADWLEEHGRGVRAEFIRLQIEIAKLEVGARAVIDANVPLWKRQQELLDGRLLDLMPGNVGNAQWAESGRIEFERGFPARVSLTAREFYDNFFSNADDLVRLRPRPASVKVSGPLNGLQSWPDANGIVTELDLTNRYEEDTSDPGVALARVPMPDVWRSFRHLRALVLAGNNIGDDGVGAVPWADLPALVDLDVSNNFLTDAGVIALINTGLPQRLERLILGGNPIGDPAAYELADRVGRSRTLKHLNLRYTDITSAGQSAILDQFPGRVDLF